jgi:fumarate hydratase class I
VLDVKIRTFSAHAASLPVGLIPQCAADRHIGFTLDGTGPAVFEPPSPEVWPDIARQVSGARRIDLDSLTRSEGGGLARR